MDENLATLDQVKSMLRIDGNDSDGSLQIMIAAASQAVLGYLKTATEGSPPLIDFVSSPQVIPERVTYATIMLVGYMYRNPDGDPDRDYQQGYLPMPVVSLLYTLRDPALA